MPFALDTNEVYRFVFSTDRNKPEGEQPTLLFRYPSCREQRQIGTLFDSASVATTFEDRDKARCDAVQIILVGWEQFTKNGKPLAYDPTQLDSVLTDTDFDELESHLLRQMTLSELEKKASALSVLSKRESSATSAVAANA